MKLSYVPVTKPKQATNKIQKFFAMFQILMPFDEFHAHTISTSGGNINANADEHNAPISEINAFNAGTTSANESGREQKKYFFYFFGWNLVEMWHFYVKLEKITFHVENWPKITFS